MVANTGTGGPTIEVMGEVLPYQTDGRPCPRHQTPCFARVPYAAARIELELGSNCGQLEEGIVSHQPSEGKSDDPAAV